MVLNYVDTSSRFRDKGPCDSIRVWFFSFLVRNSKKRIGIGNVLLMVWFESLNWNICLLGSWILEKVERYFYCLGTFCLLLDLTWISVVYEPRSYEPYIFGSSFSPLKKGTEAQHSITWLLITWHIDTTAKLLSELIGTQKLFWSISVFNFDVTNIIKACSQSNNFLVFVSGKIHQSSGFWYDWNVYYAVAP